MTIDQLNYIKNSQEALLLVSLVSLKGSSPRHLGTSMLVKAEGRYEGTIGGGQGELKAIQAAAFMLEQGLKACVMETDMTGSEAGAGKSICGGRNLLLLERKTADDLLAELRFLPESDAFYCTIHWKLQLDARSKALEERGLWPLSFCTRSFSKQRPEEKPKAALQDQSLEGFAFPGEDFFTEKIEPKARLIICGAGHVGLALAQASQVLDYDLHILDDRPDLPLGTELEFKCKLWQGSFAESLQALSPKARDCLVIVTKGHQSDYECLSWAADKDLAYIGCIGSKRKVQLLREALKTAGVSEDWLARLKAPLGLPIGAESPGEIAVSILAEIISLKYQALV